MKKFRAGSNLYRTGRWALGGLLVAFFAALLSSTAVNDKLTVGELSSETFALILSGVAVLAAVVSVLGFAAALRNRVIFDGNGVHIRRMLSLTNVPIQTVQQIDQISETVHGAPSMYRRLYKVKTNTKTYELSSYDFWGLDKAITGWTQTYRQDAKGKEYEKDCIVRN